MERSLIALYRFASRIPRPTLATIARKAGCSTQTVSLALRNDPQISVATREKLQRLAREIGYTPDGEMASLMARVRGRGPAKHRATLAVLHMVTRRFAAATPPYQLWRSGAEEAATALGYALDDFWVREDGIGPAQLERTLRARAVPGLLLLCPANAPALPAAFHPLVEKHAAAIAGYPGEALPRLNLATNDRFATGAMLYRQAAAAGHRRIGAVFHEDTEPRDDARFSAGIEAARARHTGAVAVPALRCPPDCHGEFDVWLKREMPDCLIATVPQAWKWLAACGHQAPATIGFVFWQVDPRDARWSGARQNDAEIGAAAIELLVAQIRRGERGTPQPRSRVLVESCSASGRTVKDPAASAEAGKLPHRARAGSTSNHPRSRLSDILK